MCLVNNKSHYPWQYLFHLAFRYGRARTKGQALSGLNYSLTYLESYLFRKYRKLQYKQCKTTLFYFSTFLFFLSDHLAFRSLKLFVSCLISAFMVAYTELAISLGCLEKVGPLLCFSQ